jgi:alcohol dehydrogenase
MAETMRAVTFQGVGDPLELRDVDVPSPGDHEVLVETQACGICRSDWHLWRGDWDWLDIEPTTGQVLGHEPVGTVVETGDAVAEVGEGDTVTNPFHLGDGSCRRCRTGHGNRCQRGVPMGFVDFQPGAFAEYYTVRYADHNAVVLPDGVDPVDVAGLGCRFATAYHGLVHRVDVTPGDWVAVHGCGGVGLSAVHVADAVGANVVAVDLEDEKLDRAASLGADRTVNAADVDDVPAAVMAEAGGGVAVSVDALGVAATLRNSIGSLGPGGQHLQVGMTTAEEGGEVAIPVDEMVVGEVEFYGSYGAPPGEYDEILSMMAEGTVDPAAVVSETVDLEAVPGIVERMDEFDTVGIPVCDSF